MTGEPRAALGPAVREVRGRLAAVAVLSVAGGLCEAAALVLVAQVAARLAADDTVRPVDVGPAHLGAGSVGIQIALGMGLVVVRVVCQLGASWLAASGAAVVRRRLTHEVIAAFGGAAWEVQSVEREGALLHLAGQEVERTAAATMGLAQLAANACSLAMLVAAALWTDPLAAAATIVSVAVIHLALRPLTQRTRRRVLDRSRREVDVGQSLSEAARMAEEARAFGVESAITGRVDDDVADVARHGARVWFLGLSVSTLYQGVALTLVFAALAAVSVTDPSGPATLAAVVLVLLRAFAYSQQAQVAYHTVHELLPSAGRITDALARYRERAERWGTTALGPVTSLRLLDVGYHYPTGRRALDGVTVDIPPGATVGVIGPSGAGKSTLVQILLGLREPTSGAYLVNGRLPRDYRHDDWARQVSVVPQDPQLIAGTVLDNIRFHRPHLTDEAVRAAARAARIDGEVAEWPLGDATLLGPGGTALSGGQRQRVCLARALADRPALLVLDEPTSALDARSEALVRESLRALPGDVTIVIIAHRLSTLTICSWLLVLDRGRLEASGTPDDLAGLGGFYREALELSGLA